jgi:type IV conjugative transfer system coupling protein TraD
MSHILTEGGQIVSHRLRMLRQVLKIVICSSLFLGFSVFIFQMLNISTHVYVASWYYIKSQSLMGIIEKMEVNKHFLGQVTNLSYSSDQNLSLDYLSKLTAPYFNILISKIYEYAISSLTISVITAIIILCLFFLRGLRSKSKKHISGPKISSLNLIKLRLKIGNKSSSIKIGPLPLVKGSETQHILITGGTGSGKTNCLIHLLNQVREKNQKNIVVDTTGAFVNRYYRPDKDFILNPFDDNGVTWSPWSEGCTSTDYAEIAEAFIPISQFENENYWRQASKTVFIALLQKFSDRKKTSEIIRWIQYEKLSNLCKAVEGTKAAAHLDLSSEKTASSIRSVASTYLESLEHLKDTDSPFSIREWLKTCDDSWLFLHCNPGQRATLRPLITTWISSGIRGLLALPIDLNRRIWFSIDELPSLLRVKDLEMLLTEGRKYGGCGVITLQSPAQLENLYGKDIAKIIIGNTATKIIFRELDPQIATQISRGFGENEIRETQEGISYGAHETRDSVSLSMQNRTRPVISPTQILDLPINTAFVKLAGEQAITKIKLQIANKFW